MQRTLRRHLFPPSVTDAARTFANDPKGAVAAIIDRSDRVFNVWAFTLAALGFLASSYNLFASTIVLPAISFVYWQGPSDWYQNVFTFTTLISVMLGQVGFGWLADKAGRRTVFGTIFPLFVASTLGLLQSSEGVTQDGKQTWQFTAWLFFWRIILGISIGGSYPLCAVLAAEWSPTGGRVRLMGIVFLMQPLGQLLSCVVSIVVANNVGNSLVDIDRLWRIVISVGLLWTIAAILVRALLPESWRYVWFVAQRPEEALKSQLSGFEKQTEGEKRIDDMEILAGRHFSVASYEHPLAFNGSSYFMAPDYRKQYPTMEDDISLSDASSDESMEAMKRYPSLTRDSESGQGTIGSMEIRRAKPASYVDNKAQSIHHKASIDPWTDRSVRDMVKTAWQASQFDHGENREEGHSSLEGMSNLWKFLSQHRFEYMLRLFGASACWFLFSFAYYAMGIINPTTLTKIWAPSDFHLGPEAPWWQTTGGVVNTTLSSGQVVINGLYAFDQTVATSTINEAVFDSAQRVVLTSSCASLAGVAMLATLGSCLNRRRLLFWSFIALGVILAITSGILGLAFHNTSSAFNGPVLLIVLWNLAQFLFSFGPSTLLFIVTAELFPTRYRCTCYGIAAASGSLGAVVVQAITWTAPNDPDSIMALRILVGVSAIAMFMAAAIANMPRLLPETQHGKTDIPLEECSDDRQFLPAPNRRLSS